MDADSVPIIEFVPHPFLKDLDLILEHIHAYGILELVMLAQDTGDVLGVLGDDGVLAVLLGEKFYFDGGFCLGFVRRTLRCRGIGHGRRVVDLARGRFVHLLAVLDSLVDGTDTVVLALLCFLTGAERRIEPEATHRVGVLLCPEGEVIEERHIRGRIVVIVGGGVALIQSFDGFAVLGVEHLFEDGAFGNRRTRRRRGRVTFCGGGDRPRVADDGEELYGFVWRDGANGTGSVLEWFVRHSEITSVCVDLDLFLFIDDVFLGDRLERRGEAEEEVQAFSRRGDFGVCVGLLDELGEVALDLTRDAPDVLEAVVEVHHEHFHIRKSHDADVFGE